MSPNNPFLKYTALWRQFEENACLIFQASESVLFGFYAYVHVFKSHLNFIYLNEKLSDILIETEGR